MTSLWVRARNWAPLEKVFGPTIFERRVSSMELVRDVPFVDQDAIIIVRGDVLEMRGCRLLHNTSVIRAVASAMLQAADALESSRAGARVA